MDDLRDISDAFMQRGTALGQAILDATKGATMIDDPQDTPAPTLAMKIGAMREAVTRIPKRGRNTVNNYDYVLAADVLDAVRDQCNAHGIMVDVELGPPVTAPTPKGGSVVTTVPMTFRIADTDSAVVQCYDWYGTGMDTGDKGLYKAITTGTKYFWMSLLMIPTGDDAETDEGDRGNVATGPPPQDPRFDTMTRQDIDDALGDVGTRPAAVDVPEGCHLITNVEKTRTKNDATVYVVHAVNSEGQDEQFQMWPDDRNDFQRDHVAKHAVDHATPVRLTVTQGKLKRDGRSRWPGTISAIDDRNGDGRYDHNYVDDRPQD